MTRNRDRDCPGGGRAATDEHGLSGGASEAGTGAGPPPRLILLVTLLALVVLVVLTVLGTGVAAGSDAVSIFEYEPDRVEAEPGETVTVEVALFAGGTTDIGVERVNTTLVHDPDALTVTDVESGPWLAGDDGADVLVETDIDDENGAVRMVQTREPAGEGVTGGGTLLTVTLAVSGDATPGNYTLSYGDSEVRMVNDHYQPVFTHNATLVVAEEHRVADDGVSGRFALGIATVIALVVLVGFVARRLGWERH